MKRSAEQPDEFFFAMQPFRSHLQGSGPRMGQELEGLVGEVPQGTRITQPVYLTESFGLLAFHAPAGACDVQLG